MIWYKDNNAEDIVVSTRVRLARNLDKYPFPKILNDKGREAVCRDLEDAVMGSNSTLSKEFEMKKMSDLNAGERQKLAEKHLISLDMAKNDRGSALVSKDENMSIMLLEEDHLRIQVIMPGAKLDEAWALADKVDDVIEERADYAFSEEFGYLTACPTNTGTGMRASVMMHLPALTMTNNINRIISSAASLGLTVRGLYGEGSKAYGNLYQISNQVTLGISETEIIEKLKNITGQIKKYELDAREGLKNNEELADRLWRSYGTLKYARSMSSSEAKALLSDVILARNLGIIEIEGKISPIELMVETEPAFIMSGEGLSPAERDKKRAELIRQSI